MQITVVGGTYREYCVEPPINRLLGSGLRAAGLLASLGDTVQFRTAINDGDAPEFSAVCSALNIAAGPIERTGPIVFTYETPISRTTLRGTASSAAPIEVDAECVLAFGMVETRWTVRAKTVVVDPQHGSVDALLGAVDAERITLILNEHEARAAVGHNDVEQAALELARRGADAVVVKRGALGGIVAHRDVVAAFGAIPTDRVHPLGSGDAFSAGYAHAWAAGADPLAAAQAGSRVAASHSLTGTAQVRLDQLDTLRPPLPYPLQTPRIYLAGPFFNLAQRQLIRTTNGALTHLGADVFSPLDEIGCGGDEVAEKDLDGLRGCRSVFAVLDGADAGTLFEVGWATRAGIPVVGFAEHPDEHAWTMARGTGAVVVSDLSTALYGSIWSAIQNSPGS
ncbi:PfkB family carbohydrate kinase [Mycobacterium sp. 360MFTsu5.1]|uniref:PfkB family carbohydrate kinase n=1 Tax=Mycobacterium sp. 360MFTsu5.1 TaxID=1172186 RepID=UPI0012DF046B|nr:PfkB family carbohydrate kinase [Mycobacterium sp. 360MFTsu5.1]